MLQISFPSYTGLPQQLQAKLDSDRADVLLNLGTSLISMERTAFVEKSRHGQGSDGIKWDPLARATLAARVRRRGQGRRIVEQRKALAEQIRQLLGIKTRATKQKKPPRQRRTVSSKARQARDATKLKRRKASLAAGTKHWAKRKASGEKFSEVDKLRKKRHELAVKLEELIDSAVGNHQIGVDTGLMQSSSGPGFGDSNSITVGYQRQYAKYFDEQRPLFPEPLPTPWMEKLESQAAKWAEAHVQQALDKL